jgi:3-hydroxyisobutyrate dehydrogenase
MTHGPIGFVGLGNMGGRITRRLVDAGHQVLGHDAAPGRAEACGAPTACGLADIAAQCDVILLSLPGSHVVEQVVEGPDGLLTHARELGVASLNAAGPLASFGLGAALGYDNQISNRVVDAIGDVSGGVRLNSTN